MGADSNFWLRITNMDRVVDGLVDRVRKSTRKSAPITREIPAYFSLEALFENLPATLASRPDPNSDAFSGNNVKRAHIENKSSRVYLREIGFISWYVNPDSTPAFGRSVNPTTNVPMNFRWNLHTSITDRWYSDRRCMAFSGGRTFPSNVHLRFREPFVLEPMETLTFECELLSFTGAGASFTDAIIAAQLSGYREGE